MGAAAQSTNFAAVLYFRKKQSDGARKMPVDKRMFWCDNNSTERTNVRKRGTRGWMKCRENGFWQDCMYGKGCKMSI